MGKKLFSVSGISFIEITIGLFISSLLSIFLFQFFGQITKTSKTLNNSLEYVTTIPTVFDQVERDVTGIYVPEILYEPKKKRKAPKAIDATGKKVKQSQPASKTDDGNEAPEARPIAFFCESKNNQFMILSFITTNHLPRFKQSDPERNLVVYRLIPDKDYPEFFALVRQQTTDILLPLKKFEEGVIAEYTLLRRIHRFKVSLIAPEKEKAPEKTEQAAPEKASKSDKPKVISEFSWTPDEAKKKLGVLIPCYLEIDGAYVDGSGKQSREFKFVFKIYTFTDHAERMRQEREKKQQAKKEKKPADQKQVTAPKKTGGAKVGKPQNKPKPQASGQRPTGAGSGRRATGRQPQNQSRGGW